MPKRAVARLVLALFSAVMVVAVFCGASWQMLRALALLLERSDTALYLAVAALAAGAYLLFFIRYRRRR